MALLEDLKEWKEGRCATLYSTPKKKKSVKGCATAQCTGTATKERDDVACDACDVRCSPAVSHTRISVTGVCVCIHQAGRGGREKKNNNNNSNALFAISKN